MSTYPRSRLPRLFDHFVGGGEQRRRRVDAERLGGLEIDNQFVLRRRLYRKVGLFALEDAIDVNSGLRALVVSAW
jgi:hypothetical protein